MKITIAVHAWRNMKNPNGKALVESVVVYKEDFDAACSDAERHEDIDGPYAEYHGKVKCRSYPLHDGEIHIEEVEV